MADGDNTGVFGDRDARERERKTYKRLKIRKGGERLPWASQTAVVSK